MSHRSEDSKMLVIKNYLKSNKTQEELAEIFGISTRTIRRWLRKYEETKTINRKTRKTTSYKIQKNHVDYAIKYLQQNQSISIRLLHKIVKKKYNDFNISTDHLHQVIRDNNITRKRTKIRHYPDTRYGVKTNLKHELNGFFF